MKRSRGAAIEEPLSASYEPPAVEERAPISAPLNTVAATGIRPESPRWRRPESD
jgi:hypothetical protein